MIVLCLDVGGTLIDDPFAPTLEILQRESLDGEFQLPFEKEIICAFVETWSRENSNYDFPFASHFMQEEVWPRRAALNTIFGPAIQAELCHHIPRLLERYREIAKRQIQSQPQLPALRASLEKLGDAGHTIVVASNDRKFATSTMLTWANLRKYVQFVYTSEELGAEKPNVEFFRQLEGKLRVEGVFNTKRIYVGDSETKDILGALRAGWTPIRFFNSNQNMEVQWVATSAHTVAPISYYRFDGLFEAVCCAIE